MTFSCFKLFVLFCMCIILMFYDIPFLLLAPYSCYSGYVIPPFKVAWLICVVNNIRHYALKIAILGWHVLCRLHCFCFTWNLASVVLWRFLDDQVERFFCEKLLDMFDLHLDYDKQIWRGKITDNTRASIENVTHWMHSMCMYRSI